MQSVFSLTCASKKAKLKKKSQLLAPLQPLISTPCQPSVPALELERERPSSPPLPPKILPFLSTIQCQPQLPCDDFPPPQYTWNGIPPKLYVLPYRIAFGIASTSPRSFVEEHSKWPEEVDPEYPRPLFDVSSVHRIFGGWDGGWQGEYTRRRRNELPKATRRACTEAFKDLSESQKRAREWEVDRVYNIWWEVSKGDEYGEWEEMIERLAYEAFQIRYLDYKVVHDCKEWQTATHRAIRSGIESRIRTNLQELWEELQTY